MVILITAVFFVWIGCACAEFPNALNMYEKQYNSYLIRIWQDDIEHNGEAVSPQQGEVFHIQTGRFWRVHDLKLMSDMLEDLMARSKPTVRKED